MFNILLFFVLEHSHNCCKKFTREIFSINKHFMAFKKLKYSLILKLIVPRYRSICSKNKFSVFILFIKTPLKSQ